jgi:acetyl-CoA carboxylase biotin carboxyl carrier protein
LDIQQIRAVIEELTSLMDAKKLEELEIEVEGVKVHLRRAGRPVEPQTFVVAPSPHQVAPLSAPALDTAPAASEAETGHVVKSPMVGTFYRAPAPDADPFVEVGDEVTFDTVLCIIEAMKVMNELKAEVEGTLVAIRAENGEAVEYGQPLFVIAPKAS